LFSFFFFLFFVEQGSACPGGYAGLSQGCLGEYWVKLGAHLFAVLNVSQAGLELVVAVAMVVPVAGHLFSQCNVAWRS
jgi:hypothetical protein